MIGIPVVPVVVVVGLRRGGGTVPAVCRRTVRRLGLLLRLGIIEWNKGALLLLAEVTICLRVIESLD